LPNEEKRGGEVGEEEVRRRSGGKMGVFCGPHFVKKLMAVL
jgi:hypothetical protein